MELWNYLLASLGSLSGLPRNSRSVTRSGLEGGVGVGVGWGGGLSACRGEGSGVGSSGCGAAAARACRADGCAAGCAKDCTLALRCSAYLMSKNGHIAVCIPNDEPGSRPATSTWRMETSRRRAPNSTLAQFYVLFLVCIC
jgi:hypothetical protein